MLTNNICRVLLLFCVACNCFHCLLTQLWYRIMISLLYHCQVNIEQEHPCVINEGLLSFARSIYIVNLRENTVMYCYKDKWRNFGTLGGPVYGRLLHTQQRLYLGIRHYWKYPYRRLFSAELWWNLSFRSVAKHCQTLSLHPETGPIDLSSGFRVADEKKRHVRGNRSAMDTVSGAGRADVVNYSSRGELW